MTSSGKSNGAPDEAPPVQAKIGFGGMHILGTSENGFVLHHAQLLRQPSDGSCLFHSLCCGLHDDKSAVERRQAAGRLRRELANYISTNPHVEIAGTTLAEWVRWDSSCNCQDYANWIGESGWGGGIEMAVCSKLRTTSIRP